jgi:sugar lactone lactonase YvrE
MEVDAGTLAESPVWDERSNAIYWVDIMSGQVHRRDASGHRMRWDLAADVGCLVLRRDGGAVVGLRHGIHTLDFATGETAFLIDCERDSSRTRYNDGKCDRQGRLWIGTLDDEDQATGALYRVSPHGGIACMRDHVVCSNGIDWSPDGGTFYWVDSPTYSIFAFDFDPDDGSISNQRVLVTDTRGQPDGLAVDADGCIWCARWDGWCVVRYAPDGRMIQTVTMPVARPTSVAFGGAGIHELYITSASWQLQPRDLEQQPLAGALFVCDAGVSGFASSRFDG